MDAMTECAASQVNAIQGNPVSGQLGDRFWHAAFVFSRHEKTVSEQLTHCTIEHYLPLYHAVHRWRDRKVRLLLPLFPNYIFVRCSSPERRSVLNLPSVVRIVNFQGRPAILPDKEIDALKQWITARNAEPYPYIAEGKRVRVVAGPLRGLEGIVVRCKASLRVVVSVQSIMRSVAFEVAKSDLLPGRD